MTQRRASLIVYGNCNATVMADWSRDLLGFDGDVIWARSWGDNTGASDEDLARCERLWVQLDEGNPLRYEGKIPESCAVLSFPPLNSTRLWPFGYRDPLSSDEHGGFPYGDTIVTRISEDESIHPADFFNAYNQLAAAAKVMKIEQLAAQDDHLIDQRDSQCDIKVGDFFRANFRTSRLHMTFNHPTRTYLRELFRLLVTKSFGEAKWQTVCQAVDGWPEDYEPLDTIELPVCASVADYLGLEWWNPDKPLRVRPGTHDARAMRRIRTMAAAA